MHFQLTTPAPKLAVGNQGTHTQFTLNIGGWYN